MSGFEDLDRRLRALEERDDDREALRRRLDAALTRASEAERARDEIRTRLDVVEAKREEMRKELAALRTQLQAGGVLPVVKREVAPPVRIEPDEGSECPKCGSYDTVCESCSIAARDRAVAEAVRVALEKEREGR